MKSPLKRARDYVACARQLGPDPRARCAILWRLAKNVRVRLRLGAYHPKAVYSLRTAYGLLHFRDNFGDITNLFKLLWRREYRLEKLTQPGAIVDVGANIGMAAVWFAHHNPGRPIYCIEPLPENAALIRLNCPGAVVVVKALGARTGRVTLNVDPDNVMASSIGCRWSTLPVEFETTTLDALAESCAIGPIAALKLDAEGMENEILSGGRNTLKRAANVVIETHGRQSHAKVLGTLRESGFRVESDEFEGSTGLIIASRAARAARGAA